MVISAGLTQMNPCRVPRSNLETSSSSSGLKVSVSKNQSGSTFAIPVSHELIGRIKTGIQKVETAVSGYDTAWVAMVCSLDSDEKTPQFPQCIDWILRNQQPDGSWISHDHHYDPIKATLSSTLACVVALKQWNLGENMREKGIHFILSNWSVISDENHYSPIGFDVTFSGLIKTSMKMGLNLPLSHWELDKIFRRRELELTRASESACEGAEAYLAFVSEGLDNFPGSEKLKKYQRKNGSILDSPSTTAAALTHHRDFKCLEYIDALLRKYENSVPSRYSSAMTIQLYIVNLLEELGIAHHFTNEIDDILNETHRLWLQNEEDLTSNFFTSALAFRLLRMHGYGISSGLMCRIDEEYFKTSIEGYLEDASTILELFKASHLSFLGEISLKDLGIWTRDLLAKQVSKPKHNLRLKEVEHALKISSYATLQRLEHRRNIDRFKTDQAQNLRTSLWFHDSCHEEILSLAIKEFMGSQCLYQRELENLGRWFKENRMDHLKLPRQKVAYCYFSAAATLFCPEMADARISWAKNGVLTTVVDDFFDVTGSKEEMINLIHLVDQWEENCESYFCSDQVKIIYSAIRSTIMEIGEKASIKQGYNVTGDIINVWRDLLSSFMREAEWTEEKVVPTMEQYLDNGYISFALGPIILPALFLIGPRLSPGTLEGHECCQLYHLVSTCGRLLNDINSFKREKEEGKLNSVSLLILKSGGTLTEESVMEELRKMVERGRKELLELVLMKTGSSIPQVCKDLFWNMSRILHLFYASGDGFSSPTEMLGALNSVLHDPV